MADLSQIVPGFDASQVEPNEAFDVLPAGDYVCVISDSEMVPTKSGTGQMLKLKLKVVRGDHTGRVVFDRLNLINQNATAVKIAKGTLSAISRAVGVLTPSNSSELHDRPLVVQIKQREYEGEKQNEVKGYKKYDATAAPQTQAAAQQMVDKAFQGSGGIAPW